MAENYYNEAISFENLYKAMKKCCRGVRWKDSVVRYETNGLKNTFKLSKRLKNGSYKSQPYQTFHIYEPKERIIDAPRLVDRQFQRSLCDNGLYDDLTEHFIRDNYACQIGRGTDDALERMKVQLRRYYQKHGCHGWFLKCDIQKYFPSTRHDVANKIIEKYCTDQNAIKAVQNVIDSFDGDVGIGLGSQISQLIELTVLNDLDHFIKERLRIKEYVRYADDFILMCDDRDYLVHCLRKIEQKLSVIGLQLNNKTTIQPMQHGVIFLQWRFVLTETGKVLMLMDPSKVTRQRHKMRKLWEKERDGKIPEGSTRHSAESFIANAARGNTWRLQKNIIHYYHELTGGSLYD